MRENKTEQTGLKLSRRAMKALRDAKAELRFEGYYATHELIVDFLLLHIDKAALRTHLTGVAPVPRGRAVSKPKRKKRH